MEEMEEMEERRWRERNEQTEKLSILAQLVGREALHLPTSRTDTSREKGETGVQGGQAADGDRRALIQGRSSKLLLVARLHCKLVSEGHAVGFSRPPIANVAWLGVAGAVPADDGPAFALLRSRGICAGALTRPVSAGGPAWPA